MQSLPQNRIGILCNSFFEANITVKVTPDTARILHTNITYENVKILNKIPANQSQQHIKRIICHDQLGCIWGMQRWFNITKIINIIIVPPYTWRIYSKTPSECLKLSPTYTISFPIVTYLFTYRKHFMAIWHIQIVSIWSHY